MMNHNQNQADDDMIRRHLISLNSMKAPEDFTNKVMSAINRKPSPAMSRRGVEWYFVLIPAVALILGLITIVYYGLAPDLRSFTEGLLSPDYVRFDVRDLWPDGFRPHWVGSPLTYTIMIIPVLLLILEGWIMRRTKSKTLLMI